jgi:hypothetical protein
MNVEPLLVEKWRSLPPVWKQKLIDFVEFLEARSETNLVQLNAESISNPASNLREKLQKIR